MLTSYQLVMFSKRLCDYSNKLLDQTPLQNLRKTQKPKLITLHTKRETILFCCKFIDIILEYKLGAGQKRIFHKHVKTIQTKT